MFFKPKTPYAKVRKCITTGCVTGKEISDVVGGLEANLGVQERQRFHDEVADAARYYGLGGRAPGFFQRLYLAGKDLGDKAANLGTAVVGAASGAEFVAMKEYASTVLAGQLPNIGDNLLFWLGKRKIEISGPEMAYGMGKVAMATPKIVIGMAVGALIGYLGYKVVRSALRDLYTSWRVSKTTQRIIDTYNLESPTEPGKEPELIAELKDTPSQELPARPLEGAGSKNRHLRTVRRVDRP